MPIITENVKRYFETIKRYENSNVSHAKDTSEKLNNMEINGLYPNIYAEKALKHLDKEYEIISSTPKDSSPLSLAQFLKTLELMSVIYQVNGKSLDVGKLQRFHLKLCDKKNKIEDKNYGLVNLALWHLVHDTKTLISPRSIAYCDKIVIDQRTRKDDHQNFMIDLVKLIFATDNPNVAELLEKITDLRNKCNKYFTRSSLDSYLSRAQLSYYTFIIQVKAQRLGMYQENFNQLESPQVMRKVSVKVLDHLNKKMSDNLGGTYEIMYYMWSFVDMLLLSLHLLAEVSTLFGFERLSKSYQYEYFRSSIKYCVPYRTKLAIKMMMHNEFITQRVPELTIRDAQLNFLQTNDHSIGAALHGNFLSQSTEPEFDEFNLPLKVNDLEFFGTLNDKKKVKRQKHSLYITSPIEGDKLLNIEDCFLNKSLWKVELMDILSIIRTYIWKVNSTDTRFSDDKSWEKMFIAPKTLIDQFTQSMNCKTPENSPVKSKQTRPRLPPMNAPIRPQRRPVLAGPMKIGKRATNNTGAKDDNSDIQPIDSCSTIIIPYKARNIQYEIPEMSRAIHYESEEDLPSSVMDNGRPFVVDYLQKHVDKFRYAHIPIFHRPIFQRLGLHYLSIGEQVKAAYNFSMSTNIAHRQTYQNDCLLKVRLNDENSKRWNVAGTTISHCLSSETNFHSILRDFLPNNWTILQFTMIDEIRISKIKSSLLDGVEGGCLGARNVAVLIATKYQKHNGDLTVENKVIHGFKLSGLQNMESFEKLKVENVETLNFRDKRVWWTKRREIDERLEMLLTQMQKDWFTNDDLDWLLDNKSTLKSEPKILITDRHVGRIPLECIFTKDETVPRCISRMPNIVSLIGHLCQIRFRKAKEYTPNLTRQNLEIDPRNAFFLVNPDSTLQHTQDTLLPVFKDKLKWEGAFGEFDSSNCVNILNSKDMTIYCGHGSGSRYLTDRSMLHITSPTAVFLIGCHSGRQIVDGRAEANLTMAMYLNNGCPSVMGLMWDVTDREIDRYTQQIFMAWLTKEKIFDVASETYQPVAPLLSYLYSKAASDGLQLKTLTGKAAIVYGLPIWVDVDAVMPVMSI